MLNRFRTTFESVIQIAVFAFSIIWLIVLFFVAVFGLNIANEEWNCRSYKEAPTKMIAGTCYAKQANGKWVSFSSYIRDTNINLTSGK